MQSLRYNIGNITNSYIYYIGNVTNVCLEREPTLICRMYTKYDNTLNKIETYILIVGMIWLLTVESLMLSFADRCWGRISSSLSFVDF